MSPSPSPRRLSCYIRTKNEAKRIGETVRAALAVADEVVIVDSESTDDTVAIAEAAGAIVHEVEWAGNGHQKVIGQDLCANDWVLDLDADEVITAELAAEIRAMFADGPPNAPAFMVPVVYVTPLKPGRYMGEVKKIKLYDRHRATAPSSALETNIKVTDGTSPLHLKGPIKHTMFEDANDLMHKMNRRSGRNTTLGRQKPLPYLRLRIMFGMPFYMLKELILHRMIMGGTYGWATATILAIGRWLRDVKMYESAHGHTDHGVET